MKAGLGNRARWQAATLRGEGRLRGRGCELSTVGVLRQKVLAVGEAETMGWCTLTGAVFSSPFQIKVQISENMLSQ